MLEAVSWMGVLLSCIMMWSPCLSFIIPASLWAMYLSIINLQAPFTYSYGWEWLTCEAGFLAIFLCPLPIAKRFPASAPPPRLVIWLFRWLAFRLLLGAGMSKVGRNSSACWRELTCTTTHYYTQPIPNPLSWFMHHAPDWFHRTEVALTFVEQLVLPFFMLIPLTWCRRFAGLAEMFFQFLIVATGNYAWINFIGALPCIAMLDDAVLAWVLPKHVFDEARNAAQAALLEGAGIARKFSIKLLRMLHGLICVWLVLFMAYKSKDPIKELFSAAPWINNYDKWFLMNSQGVFGFINQHRVSLVLEYTHGSPRDASTEWLPLDFKCIPGSVDRLPCLLSPYHSRLDWETWIQTTASMEHLFTHRASPQEYFNQFPSFLHNLILRILHADSDSADLMGTPRKNIYAHGKPPSAIKARFYSYTFTSVEEWRATGRWWNRKPLDDMGGIIVEAHQQPLKESDIRRSPQGRYSALLVSVLGLLAASASAVSAFARPQPGKSRLTTSALVGTSLCALCGFLATFVSALLADYPELYRSVVLEPLRDRFGLPGLPPTGWTLMQGLSTSGLCISALHALARLADCGMRNFLVRALTAPHFVLVLVGPALLCYCTSA
eukprot:TRINITY_DN24563_c0_g2_i2.p1 TRINITY_DN24563_c0_g2~~TRINITY_DN24563_c0_g2_i2.p1  ORF type:complete len:608 (-),score=47.97 TRINITY_DN24563_c0_g2_i2:257-2080(-)